MTSSSLLRLRGDFESSFAAPAAGAPAPRERLLKLRVGSVACVVRLSQISGLARVANVTPVPSRVSALLGVVGVRGALLALYDLAELLGGEEPRRATPWMLIARVGTEQLGLCFTVFEGYLEVETDQLRPRGEQSEAFRHLPELVHLGDEVRGVLRVESVVQAITARASTPSP